MQSMSDRDRTPSERKAMRSVAVLKLTGRNEGEPRKTLGEAIYAEIWRKQILAPAIQF